MTLFDLMDKLETELKLTPEQKFRTAAEIKRYVHSEKSVLLYRLKIYFVGTDELPSQPEFEFVKNTLDVKIKTHTLYATLPDEEVVTFNMGSFTPGTKGIK